MTRSLRCRAGATLAHVVLTLSLIAGVRPLHGVTRDADLRGSVELARLIRQSHQRQRDLFKTLHIETVSVTPQPSWGAEQAAPLRVNLLEVAAGNQALRQDFQIDALGRYSQRVQAFTLSRETDRAPGRYLDTPCSTPYGSSLNHRVYRSLSRGGQACVYPATHHPEDEACTPRTLLHSLFDKRLRTALENPCPHTIAETDAGLIQVLHQEGPWIYHYLIDPDQDYMVVRFQQLPQEGGFSVPLYEHAIAYRHTRSGFRYPSRSTVKRFNQLTSLTTTTLFRLNEGPIIDILPFPLGVPVKNYTCGSDAPFQYRCRTSAESYEKTVDTAIWCISGVVVDADHQPLVNVPVRVYPQLDDRRGYPHVFTHDAPMQWDAITDELGRFAIDLEKYPWPMVASPDRVDLPVGYRLVFLPEDGAARVADGIRAGEAPTHFRLCPLTVRPDAGRLQKTDSNVEEPPGFNPRLPRPLGVDMRLGLARNAYFY